MRWTRMVLVLVVATFAIAPAARAATFTVVQSGDAVSATCAGTDCQSLRAAVAAAGLSAGPDTIVIPSGDYQLVQDQIILGSDVSIVGAGARTTTVHGNVNAFRAFEVPAGVTASITGVTLAGGRANPQVDNQAFFAGGLIRNSGALSLDRVRVTGGNASSGGGIANTGGTMTIDRSLIDNNAANIGGSDSGGILNFGGGNLVVRNSTIAFNQAGNVGGYLSWGGSQAQPNTALFEFVTVARNGSVGVARDTGSGDTLRVRGSIIAANSASNCAQAPESLGGNVESGTDCQFEVSGQGIVSDELTNQGGDTDVVDLLASSPAQDIIPAGQCLPTDQRGVTRPLGAACDAGALEAGPMPTLITAPAQDLFTTAASIEIRGTAPPNVSVLVYRDGSAVQETGTDATGAFAVSVDLEPGAQTFEVEAGENPRVPVRITRDNTLPVTVIDAHPPETSPTGDVAFTYSANEPATFTCWIAELGESEQACPAGGKAYSGLANGTYTFAVRATDRAGNAAAAVERFRFTVAVPPPSEGPQATPTPTPTATPAPEPDKGETVLARPARGAVLVKVPGSNRFVRVESLDELPLGSEIDTRKGRVELRFETASGKVQTATFYGGLFVVRQVGKILSVRLSETLASCSKSGKASSAAKKVKKRKLWGSGKGNFRTEGKYSAATVRGTTWYVQDTCAGTLTRVTRGVVAVRDNVKKKTFVVRAGKRYLARPRR